MSIFGKILAILNLLVAGLFFYLAASDWGKRQAWAYAVFREDLMMDGLPVDNEQTDTAGVLLVSKLSDKTIQDLFKSGTPVKTQEEEVQERKRKLTSEINGLQDDAQKRARLKALLLPLARTTGGRETLEERIQNESIEKLMAADGPFQTEFDISKKAGKDAEAGRPPAIAHLLFNLRQSEQDDQRVAAVIGLKAYVTEANIEADVLQGMAERVRFAMFSDRATFEAQNRSLIAELESLNHKLQERKQFLTRQQELKGKHDELINARKGEIEKLQAAIKDASGKARDALKRQAAEEKAIFDTQGGVQKSLEKNKTLEKEIRALEKTD